MQQKTKRVISITASLLALLIIASVVYVLVLSPSADGEQVHKAGLYKELYGDGTLQTGKYYLHGDKNSFYYEVFEDQTIQLGGGDAAEFVLLFSGASLEEIYSRDFDESRWESAKEDGEWRSARRDYVVIQLNWFDDKGVVTPEVLIMFDYRTFEEFEKSGGGRALEYVDEKTINAGGYDDKFMFIRID
ncbi:MAG: hypothetical protein FWE74_08460 [Oscillospiraceae bacterium]|nr:hypothetical protein [Oscillospiraceae bacterium]